MTEQEIKQRIENANQGHLLQFYSSLNEQEKKELLKNLDQIDYERVNRIFKISTNPVQKEKSQPTPLPKSLIDSTINAHPSKISKWRVTGLELISKGKVGVILLAGGQGTRLGSSDPKGCYDIKLPSSKSLFQLQGERIIRLQQLAEKEFGVKKVIIPWYVMTSGPTRAATESFFRSKNFFGLDPSNVFFFNQGVLPAFTPEGKIFMESKTSPAFSPDGNGGIYAALRSEGVIADLEKRQIPFVHVYCVDNCLVKVADPVFIGYCVEKNADSGCKVVPKTKPNEAVGVICMKNNKPCVVEYSEIDQELTEAKDDSGNLLFNAANIANHFYTTEFLKKIKDFEGELEYHIARKKIKHVNEQGELISPSSNNGIKLELFIFDVLPYSERFVVLETARKDEFSPLKNAPGSKDGDSPDTSRADIMAQHVRYVQAVCGSVAPGPNGAAPTFEISPLVTYDGEGLEALSGITIPTPKYISSVNDINAIIA